MKHSTQERNKALVAAYQEYERKLDHKGRMIYSHAYIVGQLAKKFYISESTVNKILTQ